MKDGSPFVTLLSTTLIAHSHTTLENMPTVRRLHVFTVRSSTSNTCRVRVLGEAGYTVGGSVVWCVGRVRNGSPQGLQHKIAAPGQGGSKAAGAETQVAWNWARCRVGSGAAGSGGTRVQYRPTCAPHTAWH